jgi:hypothetical protein
VPLIGLFGYTVAAMVAYLAGNEKSRPFVSKAFWMVLAVEVGLIAGLMHSIADLTRAVGGLV